ncbi:hypothetical protein B481_3117 [Planococcus halocryophilus Or1]|uniref:hypothetical protein n=1 Tax=Planococcus halocryophilus TaxID=1215089 RepID=UPI0002B86B7F|nr:hypothetical protein [Planococcus halocryophilus]EMF45562.1 hypothetical protein B481_3117 [Planococcus halocryophilus Or1]
MRKYLYLLILLIVVSVLGACNSDAENQEETEQGSDNEKVFTETDIEQAEEIIVFLNERLQELEKEVNQSIQDEEIMLKDESSFNTQVQDKADKIVFEKIKEEFAGGIAFKGTTGENEKVYFNKKNSEPCSLGHCEYDGIETMKLELDTSESEEYKSLHFSKSELIFSKATYKYASEEEEQSSEIRFVKSKDNKLILVQHPALDIPSINLKEADKEYEGIQSRVPESEVEAEQEAYRKEVEEALAHYPELQ